MPTGLAQQNDENHSTPPEGRAVGQGWVASRKSFPCLGPTPSVCHGGRPPLQWRGFSEELPMTTCSHNKMMKIVELGEPCRNQPRALARGYSLRTTVFFVHFADNKFSNLQGFSEESPMTARRHNKTMKIVELGEPCRNQPRAPARGYGAA
jgi:hypothetical protein